MMSKATLGDKTLKNRNALNTFSSERMIRSQGYTNVSCFFSYCLLKVTATIKRFFFFFFFPQRSSASSLLIRLFHFSCKGLLTLSLTTIIICIFRICFTKESLISQILRCDFIILQIIKMQLKVWKKFRAYLKIISLVYLKCIYVQICFKG